MVSRHNSRPGSTGLSSSARPSVTPNAAPKVSSLPARRPSSQHQAAAFTRAIVPPRLFEHSVSYLTGVLGHMGLKDVTVIRAEGVAMGPEARQDAIEKARRAIGETLTTKLAA